MRYFIIILSIICLIPHAADIAEASPVFEDDFNDGILDPAWSVSFNNASGWYFNESGTNLTVTGINGIDMNHWGIANISTTFAPLSSFQVDFNFSWDSKNGLGQETVLAMQAVFIELLDPQNNILTSIGYCDPWAMDYGIGLIHPIGSYRDSLFMRGDYFPQPGSAYINIKQDNGTIEYLWNNSSLFTQAAIDPIGGINISFWHYAYSGGWGTSYFGTESVDLVRVEATPVPEPAAILLLSCGLIGLAGFRGKIREY